MALLGGLRQSDAGTFAGLPYFTIGMALLVPLYAFAGFILQRNQTTRTLLFTIFIVLFGFFLFAPRMHERYLYPALVFAIPLVVDEPAMFWVFAVLSLTCLFNLAYILHILGTTVFLEPRDTPAMAASVINAVTFFAAAVLGYSVLRSRNAAEGNDFGSEGERRWRPILSGISTSTISAPTPDTFERFPWLTVRHDRGYCSPAGGGGAALLESGASAGNRLRRSSLRGPGPPLSAWRTVPRPASADRETRYRGRDNALRG